MDNEPETLGGSGGKTERGESGRTELQDSRMLAMAIRRGWLKGQRWATDATVTDIMAVQQERDLTLRERAVLAVMSDIAGKDARIRQIAVKSAIAMEGQNQSDELPEVKAGTQVNVNVGVQVVESDDWYGTRAAAESRAIATAGDGASAGSPALPSPIQSGGNGKALGQNGNGSNGHH